MKRKFLDRKGWGRVLSKETKIEYLSHHEFDGYASYIKMLKIREPLVKEVLGEKIVLASDGYKWVQYIPNKKNHCVTIMINDKDEIVQWYIDVIDGVGVTEEGVPYFYDLYLDVVFVPNSYEAVVLDYDELKEAMKNGKISRKQFTKALKEKKNIIEKYGDRQYLMKFSKKLIELISK